MGMDRLGFLVSCALAGTDTKQYNWMCGGYWVRTAISSLECQEHWTTAPSFRQCRRRNLDFERLPLGTLKLLEQHMWQLYVFQQEEEHVLKAVPVMLFVTIQEGFPYSHRVACM